MKLRLTVPKVGTVDEAWRLAAKARVPDIKALAKKLGATRQYVSKILNGKSETIPLETYLSICNHLEIDPREHLIEEINPWAP